MEKYTVTCYETYYVNHEVEATSKEEAESIVRREIKEGKRDYPRKFFDSRFDVKKLKPSQRPQSESMAILSRYEAVAKTQKDNITKAFRTKEDSSNFCKVLGGVYETTKTYLHGLLRAVGGDTRSLFLNQIYKELYLYDKKGILPPYNQNLAKALEDTSVNHFVCLNTDENFYSKAELEYDIQGMEQIIIMYQDVVTKIQENNLEIPPMFTHIGTTREDRSTISLMYNQLGTDIRKRIMEVISFSSIYDIVLVQESLSCYLLSLQAALLNDCYRGDQPSTFNCKSLLHRIYEELYRTDTDDHYITKKLPPFSKDTFRQLKKIEDSARKALALEIDYLPASKDKFKKYIDLLDEFKAISNIVMRDVYNEKRRATEVYEK